MIHLALATLEDVAELVLREEDSREASEGWRELVAGVVPEGRTMAYRGPDGALLGLFGYTFPAPGQVSPWLLCSDHAARYPKDVLREARGWVDYLRGFALQGLFVFNHIPKDSVRNRAFIQHLGFRIVPSPDGTQDLFYLPAHV